MLLTLLFSKNVFLCRRHIAVRLYPCFYVAGCFVGVYRGTKNVAGCLPRQNLDVALNSWLSLARAFQVRGSSDGKSASCRLSLFCQPHGRNLWLIALAEKGAALLQASIAAMRKSGGRDDVPGWLARRPQCDSVVSIVFGISV